MKINNSCFTCRYMALFLQDRAAVCTFVPKLALSQELKNETRIDLNRPWINCPVFEEKEKAQK